MTIIWWRECGNIPHWPPKIPLGPSADRSYCTPGLFLLFSFQRRLFQSESTQPASIYYIPLGTSVTLELDIDPISWMRCAPSTIWTVRRHVYARPLRHRPTRHHDDHYHHRPVLVRSFFWRFSLEDICNCDIVKWQRRANRGAHESTHIGGDTSVATAASVAFVARCRCHRAHRETLCSPADSLFYFLLVPHMGRMC